MSGEPHDRFANAREHVNGYAGELDQNKCVGQAERDDVERARLEAMAELDQAERIIDTLSKRRIVEVQPVLFDDPPMLRDSLLRELQEHGRIELWLGTREPGLIGAITKTVYDERVDR